MLGLLAELRGMELQVSGYWQYLGFLVEVGDVGVECASCCCSECAVLDDL